MKSSSVFQTNLPSFHRATGRALFTSRRAQQLLLCLMISAVVLWLGASRARMAALQSNIPLASEATSPVVNPVTNKIYVAHTSSNSVTVINGADHSQATVAVGFGPIGIAVNPATNKIYVANSGGGDVTVINGADNSTATVAAGTTPQGIAVNSVTNKIYVANFDSDNVTVINGADNTATTVAAGDGPFAIGINQVTNKIYLTNKSGGNVTVLDGADNSTATVPTGLKPQCIGVNPVTNKIYVGNFQSNDLTVINGADNSAITFPFTLGATPFAIAVNPVTNRIYVLDINGSVRVINGADNSQVSVTVGSGPIYIALNPVTNQIYVAKHGSSNNVSVINGADNSTTTVTTGGIPVYLAANPVTNKVYVVSVNGSVWSLAVIDGADYTRVTIPTGSRPIAVAANPVTNKIYVANCGVCTIGNFHGSGNGDVTVINGSDNSTTTVIAGTNPQAIAVNPVTNKIYVANSGSDNVTVINGVDNSTTTVAAGTNPVAIAVNPVTNKIYVVNNSSATLTIIDGADNSTTTIPAGTTPFSVAFNPTTATAHYAIAVNQATNRIYVGNRNGANVMVINGADNSTATVAVGTQPGGLAVNTLTNRIYVANSGSNNVTVINGADNSTATVPVGSLPGAIAVNPLNNKIYVGSGGSGGMTVINGVDNSTVPGGPGGQDVAIAVNPATNKIYTTDGFPKIINGADNSEYRLNTLQFAPLAVAVDAVTNKIYFANNESDNVNVYTEQNVQAIPLTVSITPQAFQPNSTSRSFTFTANSTFSPTAPTVQQIHYQVDTWINNWSTATPAGSNTQSATVGPLPDGLHIIYVYATDGGDGSTNAQGSLSTNSSSPLIGPIQAYPFFINSTLAPTSAPAAISGRITTSDGSPLAGVVVQLSGSGQARAITDSRGFYEFEGVDTENFYTVTPGIANHSFAPPSRGFSLLANITDADFAAQASGVVAGNPLDTEMYFVRQQYLDFLGREPDAGGLAYWTNEIEKCGTDAACINSRRIDVSAAFFVEAEFQQTGSFIHRLYKAGLGRPVNYREFAADRPQVIGGANLATARVAFAQAFVQRAEFLQKYSTATTAERFVDDLIQTMQQASGSDLSAQRSALIATYSTGASLNASRSLALREAIEDETFKQAEYNKAFVLMEYFGYLKRDPDPGGYDFWLNVLSNREPGNYRGMVCSFITSTEYQKRFSSVVTHSNAECGP